MGTTSGRMREQGLARTVATQESRALLKDHHPSALAPRKAMLEDLVVAINKEKAKGNMILILMDANTKHDAKEMKTFYQATSLNCLASAAISGNLPRTYDRGAAQSCIDLGIGCDDVLDTLLGLLLQPFYSNGI